MTPQSRVAKNPAAKLAVLLAAVAVVAVSFCAAQAETTSVAKRRAVVRTDAPVGYTSHGPNESYMSGPRTRVYITKRSWLDAGVEVLPGDRKFNDYAFPPGVSFARENLNRPLDRSPLNPPSDLGGYPATFPLY
jgi:hypothetical protein